MTSTSDPRRFGEALRRQLAGRSQREFGDQVARAEGRVDGRGKHLPYSQQQVSFWLQGDNEPNPAQAVAIEKALRLRPGTLTRLLGFLPLDARSAKSTLDAIRSDPDLSPDMREVVIASYRSAVELSRSPSRRRPAE